jgi:hypothetical protein
MDKIGTKWFFKSQNEIIGIMPKKLVEEIKIKEPYILNESNDSEIIFSLHILLECHSEFIDTC